MKEGRLNLSAAPTREGQTPDKVTRWSSGPLFLTVLMLNQAQEAVEER